MTRPLLLDLTGAPQDMVALVMAMQVPDMLNPIAVTTGGSGTQARHAADLARTVLHRAGRPDIPVHAGSGLSLFPAPGAVMAQARAAGGECEFPAPAIIRHVMAQPADSVSICCTGALTNVALALLQEPRLGAHLHGIVILADAGGGAGRDRNIHADPEAAAIVLASGVPVTVLPRSCVVRVTADTIWMERLALLAGRGCVGGLAHQLLRDGGTADVPLAAAVAVISLLCPQLFGGRLAHLAVECRGELTRGMLVPDDGGPDNIAPNAFILHGVNVDACREVARDLLLHAAGMA
ncbi:nucleoside hydrolase [Novacetimonas pomaceti]|nr:nucleoside hydrolase [Novacetimonas pomaceti]